ncbi:hypothetical protein DL96DRAFT_1581522 [Flagelloscypha sp. PMI_526]|nr:hypothetical protein DL96DRAFT_1581522 [Flagelloscypha sp. PMI_526]
MTSFKFHSFDPWDREGNRAILFPAFRSHDLWDRSVIIFPATVKAVQLHPGAMNLNGLTFPGVQKLELDCLSVKPDQLLDRNFLQGPIHSTESSSIRELLFTNWDFPRGTLLKFLLIVPNLEVLSISGEAQSTDSFTDALIRLSSDDVPSMAAPRLRAFIVRSHQANSLNWKRLVGFVKKRSRSQGGNLEYLELIFKKNELVHRVYVIREEKKNELRGLARPLDGFAVLVE